ncbi:MAG: FG-GAP-like repeat-containing protein [Planctomycetales bacterium]
MRLSGRWAAAAGLLMVVLAVTAVVAVRSTRPAPAEVARETRQALRRGDRDAARRRIERGLALYPGSATIRLVAAELELELDPERTAEALEVLGLAQDDGSPDYLNVLGAAGDLAFRLNRLTRAEECFRRILELNPGNLTARRRLATLLALAGRRAAADLFLQILQGGNFDTHELALLGDPEQAYENPEFLKHFEEPLPDDFVVLLGAARYALHANEFSKAGGLYEQLAEAHPDDLDVLAGLGQVLVETGTAEDVARWNERLPDEADHHPEIWVVRGRFAQKRRQPEAAARCFAEAIRLDPNHWQANNQLAGLLNQRGEVELAQQFKRRVELLKSLTETLRLIHFDGRRANLLIKAADLTEELGRHWEAWGWCQAAAALPGQQALRERAERLASSLEPDAPQTLAAANFAAQMDISKWPLPSWKSSSQNSDRPRKGENSPAPGQVAFKDMAGIARVIFTYDNGDDPETPGMKIFESSGGGVAVLDYDGDAWPDLYFTQGCDWPPRPGQTARLDRQFRNLGDGSFADVTVSAGLGDDRYSQGVTVGDFNADGFPDLYVANIGANRLYRNNGDGTFTDASDGAGLAPGGWTTSCLLVDLNGDGLPDIYDVTYVAGDRPFEHVCHDKQNADAPRVCSPAVFDAEQDRLFLNDGEGGFRDVSSEAGIHAPDGKGLGIAAADFDGSGRLSLYVANDTTANFLFLSQPTAPGAVPRFVEQALLAGCAVDLQGNGQASMGIAVDDADGDGLVDLYVTNFYKEYNAFYFQQPGGTFVDRTSEARLKEASLNVLGFGTQFLDGDLDGWPDLVVANGNVDDYRERGIPFRMRAQYYANLGEGVFRELAASQLGDYFQTELLGRGMARLDWNRDGREDFVVSNLDTPASLVTNQSRGAGHFFALQLRGVHSNRDAIGTKVELTLGGRRHVKQLTAGDGYQSSNQRQLVFGMGTATRIPELIVRWPSGLTQTFHDLAGDVELLLVEGHALPTTIPR